MRTQVEMAVEAKRPMFQAVVRAENKRLVATIAEYFNGIQVAIDRIGEVLAVKYGVNVRSMHPEERQQYMAPAVNREVGRLVRQKRGEEGRMPEAIGADANHRQAATFVEDMAGNEMGRRLLGRQLGQDGAYTPSYEGGRRWADDMEMEGDGRH
jgi:hypothetical protein